MKKNALFLFVVSLHTFLFIPLASLWAQSLKLPADSDLTSPTIQHEPSAESTVLGAPFSIQAGVSDNTSIKEVILFYRTQGEEEYLSVNMEPKGANSYTALIPKEDIKEPGLEYYIQASDLSGNVALRGFSFSPLLVAVAPAPLGQKKEEFTEKVLPREEREVALRTEPEKKPWYKKWWVWAIAAGVVVAGAAAGGGGGGGGGGGAGGPTSGSATVSGPVP